MKRPAKAPPVSLSTQIKQVHLGNKGNLTAFRSHTNQYRAARPGAFSDQ